jgi:hypothetical protein
MDPMETTVGGTYHEGKIVLDRPMKWEERTRVVVELLSLHVGQIEGVWPADGSPSGQAEIRRRFEEADKIEVDEEAANAMDAALEEMRQFDLEYLKKQKDSTP